jgi:hypothetical protein
MRRSLIHTGLALAAMSSLVLGCAAAFQVDLPGTTWSIVSIDQAAPAGAPSLTFDDNGNQATLSLDCGDIPLDWAWDTDGSAMAFGTDVIPDACQSPSAADAAVRDAVLGTDEWSVQGDTHVTLHGSHDVGLERP